MLALRLSEPLSAIDFQKLTGRSAVHKMRNYKFQLPIHIVEDYRNEADAASVEAIE